MQYIRASIPNCNVFSELIALVAYFDQTYVSGTTHAIQRPPEVGSLRLRLRRTPPAFPPEIRNVHEETLADEDRTNNLCETWNKSFSVLVGHSHPSVLVTIEAFQGDLAVVEHAIEQDARGQPPVKRQKRTAQQLQKRLRALCEDRHDGRKSVADTLRGLGHCIRFAF